MCENFISITPKRPYTALPSTASSESKSKRFDKMLLLTFTNGVFKFAYNLTRHCLTKIAINSLCIKEGMCFCISSRSKLASSEFLARVVSLRLNIVHHMEQ